MPIYHKYEFTLPGNINVILTTGELIVLLSSDQKLFEKALERGRKEKRALEA
jgi:hypothetical protein